MCGEPLDRIDLPCVKSVLFHASRRIVDVKRIAVMQAPPSSAISIIRRPNIVPNKLAYTVLLGYKATLHTRYGSKRGLRRLIPKLDCNTIIPIARLVMILTFAVII